MFLAVSKGVQLSRAIRSKLAIVVGSFASLAAAIAPLSAGAQDFYSPPTELIDKVVGTGSPTLLLYDGAITMFYVDHGNAPNQIFWDKGLNNEPLNTGITPSETGLVDVGASTLANGDVIISYINSSGQASFATSSGGSTFSSVVPSSTSLGLPSGASANPALVPALVNLNGVVYVATVSSANNEIYISTTTNGTSFTPYKAGVPATTYATISKPSLAVHENSVWLGFVSSTNRQAVVGQISTSSSFAFVGNGAKDYNWSDSNTDNGYYAGVSLADAGGVLFLVGQSDGSQQYLEGTYLEGTVWAAQTVLGDPDLQEHWTPSLISESGYLYCAFQDDSNNNISYTNNVN